MSYMPGHEWCLSNVDLPLGVFWADATTALPGLTMPKNEVLVVSDPSIDASAFINGSLCVCEAYQLQ